jgi:hypothetical protein
MQRSAGVAWSLALAGDRPVLVASILGDAIAKVPHLDRLVYTAREQPLAIGRQRQPDHLIGMPPQPPLVRLVPGWRGCGNPVLYRIDTK